MFLSASKQHYSHYNRPRPHILPMYNDCPFTTASAKRLLSSRLRQISACGRGITARKAILLLASGAVVVAGLVAVWNVAFVPLTITDVGIPAISREDKVVMIPCEYLHPPLPGGRPN